MQHREDGTELLCNRCTAAVATSKISALQTSQISLQSSQMYQPCACPVQETSCRIRPFGFL